LECAAKPTPEILKGLGFNHSLRFVGDNDETHIRLSFLYDNEMHHPTQTYFLQVKEK
jgi:hypothetical protein